MTSFHIQDQAKSEHQNPNQDYDVVIVGGGIVGASLACLLAKTRLAVALLDSQHFDEAKTSPAQAQPCFDARVSAITPVSQALFAEIGIWQDLCNRRVSPYTDMKVWDADGTGSIHFSARDIQQSELGFIIENSVIQAGLYNKLQSLSNIAVVTGAKITDLQYLHSDGRQIVQLRRDNGASITSPLIIAADGANSKIRQLANFATREWDYGHAAIVTTVETELAHKATALQRFLETGPLAFLPLNQSSEHHKMPSEHYCSIVWSALPDQAEQLMGLSDEDFAHALAEAIEYKLGSLRCLGRRFSFPLRQRHAINYVKDNIALVGDAAHTIHPLAGQGVNLGLLDAQALVQEMQSAMVKRRDHAGITVLRRYQRRRIGHNLAMMGLMEGFKHLFADQALTVRWLRNMGMSKADEIALVKNTLARQAMGI